MCIYNQNVKRLNELGKVLGAAVAESYCGENTFCEISLWRSSTLWNSTSVKSKCAIAKFNLNEITLFENPPK